MLRPADLLVLAVTGHNLHLSTDGASLVRSTPDAPAFLVVALPSQHVAERAFLAFSNTREDTGPLPFAACAAGPTRLVFALPDDLDSLPCSVEGLLDWARLTPRLAPHALPAGTVDGPHPPALPADDVTAIELPWRLLLSPDAGGRWHHRHEPFAHDGRVELWHTTLHGGEGTAADVRALARRPVGDLVRGPLSEEDLADLVTLTSDFRLSPRRFRELKLPLALWSEFMKQARMTGYHYPPRPLRTQRLTLTALGGSARLEGAWDYPPRDREPRALRTLGMPTPTMAAYDHLVGLGRDQLVRVVRRGFLSTGHRAAILKVTERRVEPRRLRIEDGDQGPVPVFGGDAVLRQWFTIVVTEPTLDYGRLAGGYPRGGREMPLRALTCTTLVTPRIDLPEPLTMTELERRARIVFFRTRFREPRHEDELAPYVQQLLEASLRTPFWVRAAGRDVELTFDGIDWIRRPVTLTTPVVFVPYEAVSSTTQIRRMVNGDGRRRRLLHGQTVALADPAGGHAGDTSVPVDALSFTLVAVPSGQGTTLPDTYLPRWLLAVAEAAVHVEAVERLTGHAGARTVRLHAAYLDGGLHQAANPAGVFAELVTPEPLAFSGPAAGGLARPDSEVELLSSRQGAMAATFAKPAVSAAELTALFGDASLLGTLRLSDVLADTPALTPADYGVADLPEAALDALIADPHRRIPVPVIRTRRVHSDAGAQAVETRFLWKPPLKSSTLLAFDARSTLVLDARNLTPLDGGVSRSEVRGELRHVTLRFAGVVEVTIDRLAFTSSAGRKPDLTAEGFALVFTGPLEFIDTLKDVLAAAGFSDSSAVEVDAGGVTAGYSLGIPTVVVGVFSLQNLTLSASLAIPFDERPAGMRFAVSERHQPFLVTLSVFGGGGFFALEASARRIEAVEAAIEFGASVALNLGVASGGVSVMAGIYFGLTGSEVTLTGYLRCGGYLSVLGLISISVEFYLAFTWRDKGGGRSEVWGQARVTVCVEVACFSKTVSLSLERRFAGAGGDPTFADCVDPDDFLTYCLAFAEEGT